ncbi:MAG: ABC transporter ATP-binding protein [Flexilinea sp.]|nr:ABC transporter ATP-binding protein [Flexilinea sp.]
MSVSIQAKHIVKKFDNITVIPDLSVDIRNGEFFTLLGPSGCCKTTFLRMIAGFNSIEGGEICFDGRPINDVPAYARDIGMVFQNYAIFPHMTVRKNIEYGLNQRHVSKSEINERVNRILSTVKIEEYADRMPDKLSGGQQQRVALARAIVIEPQVLLMDEPLSNLDAKLRVEMRSAIRSIQQNVGITTVYVTHDQEEALAISDRIAVMRSGVIQQVGTPIDIYSRPANVFVSTFIGHSNLLYADRADEDTIVFRSGYRIKVPGAKIPQSDPRVIVSVRPEELSCDNNGGIPAEIKTRTFLGKYVMYEIGFPEEMTVPDQPPCEFSQDLGHTERLLDIGQKVFFKPNAAKINLFSSDQMKNYTLTRGTDEK